MINNLSLGQEVLLGAYSYSKDYAYYLATVSDLNSKSIKVTNLKRVVSRMITEGNISRLVYIPTNETVEGDIRLNSKGETNRFVSLFKEYHYALIQNYTIVSGGE